MTEKRIWLNQLYNKIFFSDLVVRNKVRNEAALRMTVKRLAAESVKQPIAYNRISNLVKSTGVNCQPNTVMDYVGFLRDACMIFSLTNYVSKFSERETIKKHYFVDNGLLNIFLTDGNANLLENLCAIHLHRQYDETQLFFYFQFGFRFSKNAFMPSCPAFEMRWLAISTEVSIKMGL